ncbi:MAG: diguanylate cyclase [Candidatus Omnitrophica bacterium]|nr:diguanylate cyclase [Candidatus Omnitrophota bacterium]
MQRIGWAVIPIVWAGLHFGGFGAAIVGTILGVSVFLMASMGGWSGAGLLGIAVFALAALISSSFYSSVEDVRNSLEDEIEQTRKGVQDLRRGVDSSEESKESLEAQAHGLALVYELTKHMAKCLSFEDLLLSLNNGLKREFGFDRLLLLVLGRGPAEEDRFWEFAGSQVRQLPLDENPPGAELAKSLMGIGGPVSVALVEERGLEKRRVAVPHFFGGTLMSVLIIEGMDAVNMEKFLILASQFGLSLKRVQLYDQIQTLALTDGLTAVAARRHFLERLEEELQRSSRQQRPLSLIMLDVDHFKQCNDRYGHLVGDAVLRQVGMVLNKGIREVDMVGRYGGEEFSLFLPETDGAEALRVAERLREDIEKKRIQAYDETLSVTVSMGIATFPDQALQREELLECADKALYAAKQAGRNRVCQYDSGK